MDLSSKARKTISSSSTSFGSPSSSSSTKGVQKFYTKIRHKIEDSIPPKITAKLHRTPKAVPVQTAKPVAAPRTKRRQHLQQQQQQQLQQPADSSSSPMAPPKVELIRQHSTPATYENIRISSNPLGFFDSDDECRMSVNESALSLEDEIFEELEKVAHDEAKLNAVLKNFDKILADFNERSTAVAAQTAKSTAATATNPSSSPSESETPLSKPDGFKQLQKSKTCSIIESRCILKNSTSDSDDPPNVKLSQYRAYQITKSLWSLQDFEEFAKSGKKPERFECKLPILHNSSLLKGFKANNETTPPKNRNLLPKSTSVWELSSSHSPPSYNGCHRTSSGSKIPIKKPPLRLAIAGRSNSFVDPPTSVFRTSDRYTTHVDRAQHSLMKSSTPIRSSSMRKLTELPTITPTRSPVHRTLSRTNSSMMSNSRGNTSINLIKKRSLSAAVSTPHSLNKVGIATKVHATKSVPPSSSLCTSVSSSRLTLKSARSEVSLRQPRYMKNHQSPHRDDVLLNRCLEKGHQILRRVEAFGSVARIDKATSSLAKRDFISPSAIRSHQRAKDDAVIPAKPQRQPAHQHNFTLIIVDKKKPSSPVTPKSITTTPLSKAPPTSQNPSASMKTAITVTTPDSASLSFAAEKVLKNPIVEACRIIPPILGDPSQQHAELMVNVKSRSPPPRTNQDAILFANRMTARANSYEKEYQSDCSDDSGHISNENDEQYANVVQQFSPTATPVSTPRHPHHHHQTLLKGKNKISELLEKFEQTATNKRAPVPEIDRVISPASTTPLIVVSPTTPASKVHTTVKVAEIKPCIQSVAVEIIPTYSNEVTIQIHQ